MAGLYGPEEGQTQTKPEEGSTQRPEEGQKG